MEWIHKSILIKLIYTSQLKIFICTQCSTHPIFLSQGFLARTAPHTYNVYTYTLHIKGLADAMTPSGESTQIQILYPFSIGQSEAS